MILLALMELCVVLYNTYMSLLGSGIFIWLEWSFIWLENLFLSLEKEKLVHAHLLNIIKY